MLATSKRSASGCLKPPNSPRGVGLAAHRHVGLSHVGRVARPQRQLVVAQRVRSVALHVLPAVDVEAGVEHAAQAVVAPAQPLHLVDVEPEAVDLVAGAQLLDLGGHQLVVAAARAHALPLHARLGGVGRSVAVPSGGADGVVAVANAPLGMQLGVRRRPADGEVDGTPYADLVTRLELRAEQVEAQIGMAYAHRSGVVGPVMVALGEHVDQVDVSGLQRVLPLPLVETAADAANQLGGMKVEVDLARPNRFQRGPPTRTVPYPVTGPCARPL